MAQTIVPWPLQAPMLTTRTLLSTTTATPVATWTPGGRNSPVMCGGYVSVPAGSATTLTLTIAWTDPDTGADTYTWVAGTKLTGNTILPPVTVLAAAGSPVTVTATAGTANVARVTIWTAAPAADEGR